MNPMKKVRNITFAATVAVLLLTGFPRRASAACDIFLTISRIPPEAHANIPVAPIVSAVLSALSIL